MIGKWRQSVDKGGAFGDLLADLSKASDVFHVIWYMVLI